MAATAFPPLPRRLILFGAPLVLGLVGTGHPKLGWNDPIFATIQPIATWWTVLHVLQLPLFALLGIAAYLLTESLAGTAVRISRYALALFIVVYPAFDAAVGISSGIICSTIAATDGSSVEPALYAIFWGPVTGSLAIVGSLSWLVAMISAALALRKASSPILTIVMVVLSGLSLAVGHFRPFGALACLCFLIAAITREFASGRHVEAARA